MSRSEGSGCSHRRRGYLLSPCTARTTTVATRSPSAVTAGLTICGWRPRVGDISEKREMKVVLEPNGHEGVEPARTCRRERYAMNETTNILTFRQPSAVDDPLTEILRNETCVGRSQGDLRIAQWSSAWGRTAQSVLIRRRGLRILGCGWRGSRRPRRGQRQAESPGGRLCLR